MYILFMATLNPKAGAIQYSDLDKLIFKDNFLDNYCFISMFCSIFFMRDSFFITCWNA